MNNSEIKNYAEELGLKIKYKDESILMKIISFILRPINPTFMNKFYTTINQTMYVPRSVWESSKKDSLAEIVAHEAMHAYQARKLTFPLYAFLYLFPQSLAIFAILLPLILLFFLPWYWAIIPLFLLVCLGPWPAYWRKNFEIEGYTTSLYVFYWIAIKIKKEHEVSAINCMFSRANHIETYFTGS